MDIRILNIRYNLKVGDLYAENSRERLFEMEGYIVEYFLGKYIKSIIEIPSSRELTIDEIKDKIKETYERAINNDVKGNGI